MHACYYVDTEFVIIKPTSETRDGNDDSNNTSSVASILCLLFFCDQYSVCHCHHLFSCQSQLLSKLCISEFRDKKTCTSATQSCSCCTGHMYMMQ